MLQSRLTPKMNLLEAHYIHQTCDILDGLLEMFNVQGNPIFIESANPKRTAIN